MTFYTKQFPAIDPATGFRKCSECREVKPPSAYSRNRNKRDGLDARCRECKSLISKRRYAAMKATV